MSDLSRWIDQAVFDETAEMLEDSFADVCVIYQEDAAMYLAQLGDAVESTSIEQVVMPAHTIKSLGKQLGFIPLGSIAEQLEHHSKEATDGNIDADWAQIKHWIEELSVGYQATIDILKSKNLI